jgi:predicted Zn-dependent protease
VTRYHTVVTANQAAETSAGAQILAGVAGVLLGQPELASLAGDVSGSIIQNGFSRDQEDQADRLGLRYAFDAGYDVTQFPRVFEIFLEVGGDSPGLYNDLFGSHSTNRERIETTREIAAREYVPLMVNPVVGRAEYERMLDRIR